MSRTPASLLQRLRQPNETSAWSQFVKLYTPLIYRWARRAGLAAEEASDLVQDVFVVLVEKMPHFQYDRNKSFRAWLKTVTLNKWRDHIRRVGGVPKFVDMPDANLASVEAPQWWDETEYRNQLVKEAMGALQAEFQESTWKAFRECAVSGRAANEVAKELGISINAVYLARSRVLRRLREELAGLLS